MSPPSLIAVWIVLAGVVLLLACAVAIAAEKPPAAAGQPADVSTRVWCPAAAALTRVGLGRTPGGPRLTVVTCERFSGGPVECDRACIETRRAA